MPKRPLESLGVLVREKRGSHKLRETAKVIGIGPATLMRVESGRIPDVETFGKLCRWLRIDPKEFLGFDAREASKSPTDSHVSVFTAHLKTEKTPKKETVQALAQMILIAMSTQPVLNEPEN
jgi:transcriptional regulator with XRE-family HTH domain